jgi:hypothetical protein
MLPVNAVNLNVGRNNKWDNRWNSSTQVKKYTATKSCTKLLSGSYYMINLQYPLLQCCSTGTLIEDWTTQNISGVNPFRTINSYEVNLSLLS